MKREVSDIKNGLPGKLFLVTPLQYFPNKETLLYKRSATKPQQFLPVCCNGLVG